MPHLDRDGVKISYDVHGRGPRTMLLTHGFAASSAMFARNVEALADDVTAITWDMRGHGRSDYPRDAGAYSPSLAVGDMLGLLDDVGADRAVVGGHSLGGYLSLELVLAHPERVEALVLIDTGPGFRNDAARDDWNAFAERYAVDMEARGLGGLPSSDELRTDVHRDASGLIHVARQVLPQYDAHVIEALPAITVPTLVIVGENDKPFLGAASYMAAKIPGATSVTVPGAAHAPNVSHPDVFNHHLRDFLSLL